MNCQQFQEVLPHIIESGGSTDEEAHLQSCTACSDLVRDLKYIAEQAKLLLPMRDPSPRVWTSIEQSLEREGLIREGRMSRQGHTLKITQTQKKSWTPLGSVLAALAVITLAVVVINYHPRNTVVANNFSTTSSSITADDQNLISQISQERPEVRQAYEDGLKEANAYISDAQKAVNANPNDDAARQHLQAARQQKATLYHMATLRSLP
jgi:hypothetical protein